jgi:hypothetical protein
MNPPAYIRALACPGESSGGRWGRTDANNRRGQVKSRNVRPVGWELIRNEHSNLGDIARLERTLLFSPTRRSCSPFLTLRALP